jgi:hypothetical protein
MEQRSQELHLGLAPVTECLGGMFGERCAQPLEVAHPQRDRPASRNAARRVGEAHVPLSLLGFEKLNHGCEPLLADTLRERQLLDGARRPHGVAVAFLRFVAAVAMKGNVAGNPSRVGQASASEV